MKRALRISLLTASLSMAAAKAFAKDDIITLPLDDFFAKSNVEAQLGDHISFYFGDKKPSGKVVNLGQFKTNKKTKAFKRTAVEACEWALLSALISLRDRALKEGGNAVINIESNYKGYRFKSNDSFQCGSGNIIAGVALVGDVVEIK